MVSLNLPKLLVESVTEPQNLDSFLLNCTPDPAKVPYHCAHFPGFMRTYMSTASKGSQHKVKTSATHETKGF